MKFVAKVPWKFWLLLAILLLFALWKFINSGRLSTDVIVFVIGITAIGYFEYIWRRKK